MGHDFERLSAKIITLEDVHFAQVKSKLSGTGPRGGLLINFKASTSVVKRMIRG